MAIPKLSELSTGLQVLIILLVAVAVWAGTEFFLLKPVSSSIEKKQTQSDQIEKELVPLRPYELKQKMLIAENQQLEIQLTNLRQIVPDEKEVDNFIRMVEAASLNSGIEIRRFTAKPLVPQDYYMEVPFEVEIDGPYFQVMAFFDRLSKLERIVNVSDLKMASIREGKGVGNKVYAYSPNETVVAVGMVTTFFSNESQTPVAKPGAKPGAPAAKPPVKK